MDNKSAHATFLLISAKEESWWFNNLVRSLSTLGELQVIPEKELQYIFQRKYDVVVVDAAAASNEWLLVSRVHSQQPKARIIVVSAVPSWRRAREVILAGAVDYISKFLSEEEFHSVFKNAITNISPFSYNTDSGSE